MVIGFYFFRVLNRVLISVLLRLLQNLLLGRVDSFIILIVDALKRMTMKM